MKNTKFLKAYCDKSKKYYGLEIKKFGSTWKVIDFIELSKEEASVLTSEIKQPSFSTNENLLPCKACGKRTVGACACPPRSASCRVGMGYEFQCIYCKNLKIDYTPARAAQGRKEGDTIVLSQGQVVKLHFEDDKPLTEIYVGVGWDPSKSSTKMDIDSSVIVCNQNGDTDIVYFGDLSHSSGCVRHHGDNLTGRDSGGNGDDENISVYLNKVPSNRDRLYFVLNIYNCDSRCQRLGDVKNMYIRLYDPISRKALVEYRVDGNLISATALTIGVAFRDGRGWSFKAIGRGSNEVSVQELADNVVRAYPV